MTALYFFYYVQFLEHVRKSIKVQNPKLAACNNINISLRYLSIAFEVLGYNVTTIKELNTS